jgi:hypothetical protein
MTKISRRNLPKLLFAYAKNPIQWMFSEVLLSTDKYLEQNLDTTLFDEIMKLLPA